MIRRTLTLATLFVVGCTTQAQRIGVDNARDVCRQYLVALDATGNYFGQSVAIGAGIGAAIGAGIGYLSTGKAKGAAIGAGAGAATGAAAGYAYSQQQQQQQKSVLYQHALNDYEQNLAKIDEAELAFKKLEDCRNGTLRRIAADYRGNRLDRTQATMAWREVLDFKARDLQIAANMGKDMSQLVAKMDREGAAVGLPEARSYPVKVIQPVSTPSASPAPASAPSYNPPPSPKPDVYQAQRAKAQIATTTSAQTHLQSYNYTVAVAQNNYNAQLATANNPDGFETTLRGS